MKNYYIEENSIIIEWANDKNGRCQAYSIYEDDILLKSNIPINNSKINVDELHHNHGKLTLKCDSFVKQKREAKDDGVEVLSSEENSDEESDTDDDSIINAIDNFFFPSDENEDKENESSNIIEKVFKLNDKVNNNDNEIKSDTKTGNKNNNDNESDEGKDKNRNEKGVNNDEKKQNIEKNTNDNKNSSKDIDSNENDKTEEEDDSEENNKPVHIGIGVSLSFLLTGGLFLSVMKIRKMSDLQLEINAQEMSADSVYVPSPRISNTGSMSLSMSSLELGNASFLQENSFGSTLNSFVV